MGTSIKEQLSLLPPDELEAFLDTCSERDIIEMGREEWWYTQRPEQVPPEGNWTVHLYLGGRGCVAPWTMVHDPVRDSWERIDVLAERSVPAQVSSWTGTDLQPGVTQGAPFLKGLADYWHVELADGRCVTVTDQHRFLTPQGWRRLADVHEGQLVLSASGAPAGPVWPCPYGWREGVHRYSGIDAGCRVSHDTAWMRLVSIMRVGYGPYYDMSVPGTENYVANGIIHHNTGKTKSGAEWIVERCEKFPFTASGHPANRLVMAYNVSDALTTCIEGESGILSILRRKGMVEDRDYSYTKAPKPKIVFLETGCVIHFTGANKPDVVRGLNLSDAWLDEIVKWPDPEQIWKEGVHHALRSDVPGDKPRVFVTTTPKPIEILKKWTKRKDGFVSLSRGSTFDNMANLNAEFIREIRLEYEGTLIGRQEIYGELLDDMEGPLFSLATINDNRVEEIPDDIGFRVVGVDPCLTGGENGDLMGCVAAYRDRKDHYYVVEDASVRLSGRDAARHVWKVFARHSADVLAVETNLGKQWLTEILRSTYKEMQDEGIFPQYTTPPIKEIHSNHGKKLRAEPVAIRYQQKRVHHVGAFEHLETQMVGWDPTDSKVSPDRLDALVHAIRYLMEGENRTVRFFSPTAVTVRGL